VRGFTSREGGANVGTLVVNYTPPNAPPSVSITSPVDAATFVSPADLTIQATAGDSDGSVAKVEFFVDAKSIGSVTQSLTPSPPPVPWNPCPDRRGHG